MPTMWLFKRKKRPGIHADVTAIDGMVLARRGDSITGELLAQIAGRSPYAGSAPVSLADTDIYADLMLILSDEKYSFISSSGARRPQIELLLRNISLNRILTKELDWMRRWPYHYHHSLVITLLVTRMVSDFFEDVQQAASAAACALTHDIGITRVPREVLNKIGRLSDEESRVLREHPVFSYLLLSYYLGDSRHPCALAGYDHHEDLLGKGYPRGIIQTNIVSQCIQLCDYYDALISARPFRPAHTPGRAWKVLSQTVENNRLDSAVFVLLNSYLSNLE